MKIGFIAHGFQSGGAAIAARRIIDAAVTIPGVEVLLFGYHKQDNVQSIYQNPPAQNDELFRNLVLKEYLSRRTELSNTIFSVPISVDSIGLNEKLYECDIINVHWSATFLSIEFLKELSNTGKPIVFTLHDEWGFTGGCHYTAGCIRFIDECNDCPQLIEDPLGIVSRHHLLKSEIISKGNFHGISPSEWLAEQAERSLAFKSKKVKIISNGLDLNEFKPDFEKKAKNTVQFLFGCEVVGEKRKGLDYLKEAILLLGGANSGLIENISFRTFGKGRVEIDDSRLEIEHYGSVEATREICSLYAEAHFLIIPSLEDNLPNTALEALACGTPVIAFKTGGLQEIVKDGKNGFLCDEKTPQSLAATILRALTELSNYKEVSQNARESAATNYDAQKQASIYVDHFKDLIEQYRSFKRKEISHPMTSLSVESIFWFFRLKNYSLNQNKFSIISRIKKIKGLKFAWNTIKNLFWKVSKKNKAKRKSELKAKRS